MSIDTVAAQTARKNARRLRKAKKLLNASYVSLQETYGKETDTVLGLTVRTDGADAAAAADPRVAAWWADFDAIEEAEALLEDYVFTRWVGPKVRKIVANAIAMA